MLKAHARLLACVVLVTSVAWTTLPQLARRVVDARKLSAFGYEERRARVIGPLYPSAKKIDRSLPPDARLALVFDTQDAGFLAAFAAYYLYPRDVRLYNRLSSWRNAPNRPEVTALVDENEPEHVVRLDYIGLRRRMLLDEPVTKGRSAESNETRQFLLPFAGSLDGAGERDVYTVEGVIVPSGTGALTLTFYPSGTTKTYALAASKELRFTDVVSEAFERLDVGWLEARSTVPVRASFWYVDRGRGQVERIPVVADRAGLPIELGGGEKLYVINAADHESSVSINGEVHGLAAHAFAVFPAKDPSTIESADSMYAFTTRRDPRGWTHFEWPDGSK
jgi:hypothetical protein